MERKYLSGNIRERLQDLMKERKITQSELAAKIGMDVSTLSRFISNATGKLGDENIKKIAKEFEVSTDFLLGVTDIPDRMNYDIAELGLSVQAAKNLYTGKVNAEVVNRLLENKNFAAMTNMIAHYFDDTLAAGYIRSQSTSFEAKHMGEIVSLDEVTKFENRDRHAFVPDSNMTNPAQIYIAKETHEELHAALDAISNREREYLLYRFGFEDNIEHPLTETAEHFFLSESRAKSTERLALDNVWLELPWWFH